jgi:DNA-binding LacI/PurR family transcriptional regulator
LWVAQQRGLSLPADLSVVGFDDTPRAMKTSPPLTVIRQPIAAMVERAITLLIADFRDAGPATHSDVILDFSLVERASTARLNPGLRD